jgi:hypothetical protein
MYAGIWRFGHSRAMEIRQLPAVVLRAGEYLSIQAKVQFTYCTISTQRFVSSEYLRVHVERDSIMCNNWYQPHVQIIPLLTDASRSNSMIHRKNVARHRRSQKCLTHS